MKTIKIWNDNPSDKQIKEIASAIEAGKIILLPTDTLYGIACDALNAKAIDEICRIKRINPEKNHLSVICSDISMAAQYAKIDNKYFRLLRQLTPGPFTFLFKALRSLPKAFKGRKTVGIRIPANETARMIAEYIGHPILTTSIEYADEDHARDPELIAENYQNVADIVIIGEEGDIMESTIIDCTDDEPTLIREGKGKFIY